MFKILDLIENRINNLIREKDTILDLLENNKVYEEDYLTHRLCEVASCINELDNLRDDILYKNMEDIKNEKEN